MAEICGFPPDAPYAARLRGLAARGVALWDVLAACERSGSLDSAIRAPRPNDVPGLLARCPSITRVCCNGQAAGRYLRRYFPETAARAVGLLLIGLVAAMFSRAGSLPAGKRFRFRYNRGWMAWGGKTMETADFTLPLKTDAAGRRLVEVPHCGAGECVGCGGCGTGRAAVKTAVVLENGADFAGIPDGTPVRVTVRRANPALLAAVLLLLPLAFILGGGGVGFLGGGTWGMLGGAAAAGALAVMLLRKMERRWRALSARAETYNVKGD